jgi:hypothetical protein
MQRDSGDGGAGRWLYSRPFHDGRIAMTPFSAPGCAMFVQQCPTGPLKQPRSAQK